MIVENIFALGAQAGMGATTLQSPLSDLHSAQQSGANFNGHMGAAQPRVRMGGQVGRLTRSSDLKQPQPFGVQMEQPLFNNEPRVNVPHPVTRLSKPLAPDISSVSRDELCFYRVDDPRNNKVMKVDNQYLQYNPMSYVNPAQWNAIMIGEQKAMWDKDTSENRWKFKSLTPKELFFQWRLEGVVEQNGQGVGSSLFTKSVRNNQPLCIITKGHQTVNSYWPYAQPGDDLYIVIKRMNYNPNFCLNTKENNSSSGAGQRRMSSTLPFRPIQMGFYHSRRGAVLPSEVYESEDDDGITRSDAHVIRVGTLHFLAGGVAQFDQSHRLSDNNMDVELHAYVDSNEGVSRNNYTPQKMILDHNNGIYPI